MKRNITFFLIVVSLLFSSESAWSQKSFEFSGNRTKDKVNFKLINNLVLIPVKVNGVSLTFLLDSGASSTVIFSFEDTDSIQLYNYSMIKLRGLGKGEPVDALKSEGNTVEIGKAKSSDQTIFVVFDGALNFSSRLGYPVHGIIGYDFLKDFVVEVNNQRERLRFFKPDSYKKKNCRRCIIKEIYLKKNKPYISASYFNGIESIDLNLLIDSGSGDALWLFEHSDEKILLPSDAFEDYLGLGINGNIYGKRSKVASFTIDEFQFSNVNTAYPDVDINDTIIDLGTRNGSIGGEVLKRFNWTIDYTNKFIKLKKNSFFKDPFHYNMSGLTLQQGGFTLVKEQKSIDSDSYRLNQNESHSVFNLNLSDAVELKLKQLFEVVEVRKNSPADLAGIRIGDEILEINNKPAYQYELNEINQLFYSREGRTIKMKILRNGIAQKIKFELKDI